MEKKYQIIYADPPWEYELSGSVTKSRGLAKQHYPTMTLEEICKLPVELIADTESVLLMWATFPTIDKALKVIREWGFVYKNAAFVWVKKNKNGTNFWGMGNYTRANAEVCLLGIAPKLKAKSFVKAHNVHQVVETQTLRHSEKPHEVRERIIRLFGDRPRIELFAREHVEGWDVWGNEVKSDIKIETVNA